MIADMAELERLFGQPQLREPVAHRIMESLGF